MVRTELLPQRIIEWANAGRIVFPDSGGPNGVSLSRALAQLCGVDRSVIYRQYACSGGSDADPQASGLMDALGHFPAYVFILVDGLGISMREMFPAGGFLSRAFIPMRAVFPSTTAAAVTGLYTGRWPGEIGLSGWHTWLPERRLAATILPFYDRATRRSLSELGLAPGDIIEAQTLLPKFSFSTASILLEEFTKGVYNTWAAGGTPLIGYDTVDTAVAKTLKWFNRPESQSRERGTFAFVYFHQVDKAAHESGPMSSETAETISRIDQALGRLRRELPPEVRMVVTADHGLIEVPEASRIVLSPEHPMLEFLETAPTGEGVTPVFHVKPGAAGDFERYFNREYGETMHLLSSESAVASMLFGPYGATPATRKRLGDFIGIAADPLTFRYVVPDMDDYIHIGYHGGLRPGEMEIPLYIA